MAIPNVYKSTDPDAPVLNGLQGSLITVLDACLVSGYGSSPGAGWTKEFSAANQAIYRMGFGGTSNRHYLRVNDASPAMASSRFAELFGHPTVSSLAQSNEVNVVRYPSLAVGNARVYKSSVADAGSRAWLLVATPKAVWMFITPSQTIYGVDGWFEGANSLDNNGFFFGEYEKYFSGHDDNVCLMGGHNTTQTILGDSLRAAVIWHLSSSQHPNYFNQISKFIARGPFLGAGSVPFLLTRAGYWAVGNTSPTSAQAQMGRNNIGSSPDFINGQIKFAPLEMIAPSSNGNNLIGRLPGAYVNITGTPPMTNWGSEMDGTGDFAGQRLVQIHGTTSDALFTAGQTAAMFLNLSNW